MSTNIHLSRLERDLEADLAEAKKELELGREEALARLNEHRGSLGAHCGDAIEEIESLAHDADEDLANVRARLGELNLLVAEEEVTDLGTFDEFRDRILRAMTEAEEDLQRLKARGDAWSARESQISGAWTELARRLELVRLHLVHEAEVAAAEFESERRALASHLEEIRASGGGDHRRRREDLMTKVGREFTKFLPAIKAFFMHPDATVPQAPGEEEEEESPPSSGV